MPTTLKDLRREIDTVKRADDCFAQIARAEIEIAKKKAQAEAKIATIKKNLDEQTAELVQGLEKNQKALSSFVGRNPALFQKPRKRKTPWGRYGLQKASRVEIYDPEAALEYSIKHVLGCTKTVLDLPAARKLVKDGTHIAGCELAEGDIAHYTVAKALLDEAKEEA